MRLTSTDPTALIVRVPAQPEPAEGTGPLAWKPSAEDQPPAPEPLEAPGLTVLAWVIPMVVAAGLGAWALATPGLGEEELSAWGMVTADWAEFRALLAHVDAGLGPYYVLLRLWTQVAGDGDLALRVPSVVFTAGAAALTAAIGIRLGGRRVGLVAGLLFALLPMSSRYAQEAAPWALSILAAALASLVLLRLIERPGFAGHVGYALTIALLGLAQSVGLLLLVAHGLTVWLMRRSGKALAAWLTAAVLGAAPAVPLIHRQQTSGATDWIPPISWARFAEAPPLLFGLAIIAGAVMALALAAMSMREPVLAVTAWAVAPAAALALVSLLTPLWVPRYLLFTVPAWVLLASLALRRLTLLRGLVAVLAIGLLAVPTQLDIRTVGGHTVATRDIADVLRVNSAPGDVIVFGPFANGDQRISRDAVLRYVEERVRPADKLMAQPPRTGGRLSAQECPDVEIPACFGRPERVWVVRKGKFTDVLQDIGPAKEQLLKRTYVAQKTWPLKGFTMALYVRKPTA